jgi:hypothetical protein
MISQTRRRRNTAAPDRSLFIITRDFGALGLESVTDPNATLGSIINDIATGQIDRVAFIVECNAHEGWSKDCTDDILDAAEDAARARRAA